MFSHGLTQMLYDVNYFALKLKKKHPMDLVSSEQGTYLIPSDLHLNCVARKAVSGVSDQVGHKPGCTAAEDGKRLETSDLRSRGIVINLVG